MPARNAPSAIDAQKNQLALEQANRALAKLEHDIQSHGVTGKTGMDLAREKMHKAKLTMDQAQQNIERMRVVSPIAGLVAIQKNLDSAGGFFWGAASIPDYHEGDQAQAGSAIAQVIDSRDMELAAKVSELDRANISTGQAGGLQWVVPVSAVVTNASGASSVTVVHGTQRVSVAVRAGLAYAGREVVRPIGGGLTAGEQVVIGLGGSG